jgi:thioredoxin 1
MLSETNDKNFGVDVLESEIPVLVDFSADWCGPCNQLAPVLEELAKEYKDKIKFVKINIEKSPEVPTQYGVRGIPNLIIFSNGKVKDSKVGALPKKALQDWIDEAIA